MTNLQINVEKDNDVDVMVLRGRIDIASSPYLRIQLLAVLRKQPRPATIAFDLSGLAYMDTSGVAPRW